MKPCNPRRRDIPGLTGLRFIAAGCILFNHLLLGSLPAAQYPSLAPMLRSCGLLGMDVFFVLSGFIIHYNYSCKLRDFRLKPYCEFASARISRLYPLYIFAFLLDFFTSNYVFSHFDLHDILISSPFFLTLTQSWVYFKLHTGASLAYALPNASITWSISTEMLLYCAFPLILWFLLRDSFSMKTRIGLIAVVAVLSSLLLRVLFTASSFFDSLGVALFGPSAGVAAGPVYAFSYWLAFIAPYTRVFEFLLGVLCSHLYQSLEDTPPGPGEMKLASLLALAATGFVLATFLPDFWRPNWVDVTFDVAGFYIPIMVLVFVCARYSSIAITRLLSLRRLVIWGERSYSIYLLHIVLYNLYPPPDAALGGPMMLRALILLCSVIFMANIFYTYIEMPYRKALRAACNRQFCALFRLS